MKTHVRYVEQAENYWRNNVLAQPSGTDLGNVVVRCNPTATYAVGNHATHIAVDEGDADDLLRRVNDFFASKGATFTAFRLSPLTRPRSFATLLERHRFTKWRDESVMVFEGDVPDAKRNPDVEVRVITEQDISRLTQIFGANRGVPTERLRIVEERWRVNMRRYGDRSTWYLAELHGTPVGRLVRTSLENVSCIQGVGTLPDYRRRGVATTLTLHAVRDAIEEDDDLTILQTTQGGNAERLYGHIGFTIDYTLSWYSKQL